MKRSLLIYERDVSEPQFERQQIYSILILESTAMALKLLATALLAITSAKAQGSPCHSSDFSLAMRIGFGSNYVSLKALDNGTDGTQFLVAGLPSTEAGTPGMFH